MNLRLIPTYHASSNFVVILISALELLNNMPVRRALTCLLSIIAILTAGAALPGARAESRTGHSTIVYGADRNFPPWEWVTPDGILKGFNIDLLTEIARSAGLDIRFVYGNWSDIRQRQWDGEIDVTAMFMSDERQATLKFSDPIALGYDTVWIREGDPDIRQLSDLSNKTVIVQQTGFAAEYFAKTDPTVRIVSVESEPAALVALNDGRGDAAILSEATARTTVVRLGLDRIRKTGSPILPRPLAFTATPDKAGIIDILNQNMLFMRADGRFEELEGAWFDKPGNETRLSRFMREWGWGVGGAVLLTVLWLLGWSLILRHRVAARTAELEEEINEHELAEEEIRQSSEVVDLLFNANPVMMSLSELEDGRYVEVNPAVLETVGLSREQIIGRTSSELNFWDDPRERDEMVAQLREKGRIRNHHVAIRLPSGRVLECMMNADVVEMQGRRLMLSTMSDMTSLKAAEREKARLENQLRQIQKIEMAGRLAGGVAHDFNNQLTIIQGYCDVLGRRLTSAPDVAVLDEIRQAVRHSSSLTSSLLAFSRRQVRRLEVLNPTTLIAEMEQAIRVSLGVNLQLVIESRAPDSRFELDRGQFVEVIYNIVANAKDAMGASGTLTISIDAETVGHGRYISTVEVLPGDYVVISLSDDGVGMDEETQRLMFEPFFTTKEVGKGIGLGLSTVYGIIKQNGGYIEVVSACGEGTCIRLMIPSYDSGGPTVEEHPRQEESSRGTETILLTEDEKGLFQLLCEVLRSAGYRVLAAERPSLAIELAMNEKPDILVTDVVMPEMSGRDLATQIKAMHPDIKVLYMSGYPRDTIAAHGILNSSVDLLNKPFSLDEFLQVIRRVLDS